MNPADTLISIADKLTTITENCPRIYAAGERAAWGDFWDAMQNKGARKQYAYCFYSAAWNDTNFVPKYDFVPTQASSMFQGVSITDLRQRLLDAGVQLDLSDCNNLQSTFQSSAITTLPVIDTTAAARLSTTFANADRLHTIERLILKQDGSQTFSNPFVGASALAHIEIAGRIGSDLSFAASPLLTEASLASILAALADHSGSDGTHTLTLGTANLDKLTAAQRADAEAKGWTLA